MSAPLDGARRGLARFSGRGPLVPVVGVTLGVVALTAAVTLSGSDSSRAEGGVVAAPSEADPAVLPAANSCHLSVAGTTHIVDVAAARTLTQVAAVGWQVKAPTEMIARVLDVATARKGQVPSVTDTLDLFTREDATAPSEGALADLAALSVPGALTCVYAEPAVAAQKKGSSGLTPRADALRQGVVDAFGKLTMTGFGAKSKPTTGAEEVGRALTIRVPTTYATAEGPGWVLANWLAARGGDYKLDQIVFTDRTWVPAAGWRLSGPAAPADRVYVSTAAGAPAAKATTGRDNNKDKKKSGKKKSSKKRS